MRKSWNPTGLAITYWIEPLTYGEQLDLQEAESGSFDNRKMADLIGRHIYTSKDGDELVDPRGLPLAAILEAFAEIQAYGNELVEQVGARFRGADSNGVDAGAPAEEAGGDVREAAERDPSSTG